MKKKILTITILALAVCLAFAFANPVMAATCTKETCEGGEECNEQCDETCCPVLIGEKCYPSLEAAVAASKTGETITLRADVELSKNVGVKEKAITIDGKGHHIKPTEAWSSDGNTNGDQSLITADKAGAKVTLKNLTLENSKKYGAQAFNGGELILDKVTVNNCSFGGILANGGTVTVKDLKLGHNGTGSNNGIEIAKQNGEYKEPKLVMDGILESEVAENAVYIATNDALSDFTVENTDNTVDQVFISGGSIVIADENGKVLYTSNEKTGVTPTPSGDSAKTVFVVTVTYNGEKVSAVAEEGKTLAEVLDLDSIKNAVEGQTFVKFVDSDTGSDYDEANTISSNLNLIAVYSETPTVASPEDKNLDPSPETGVSSGITCAISIATLAMLGIVALKKKNTK